MLLVTCNWASSQTASANCELASSVDSGPRTSGWSLVPRLRGGRRMNYVRAWSRTTSGSRLATSAGIIWANALASSTPTGFPRRRDRASPTRRPASLGEAVETDLRRFTFLGLTARNLGRLAICRGHRQAGDHHRLAPKRLPSVLGLEGPSRPARAVERSSTTMGSNWSRAYIERVIGSIRRECLGHASIVNEASLRRIHVIPAVLRPPTARAPTNSLRIPRRFIRWQYRSATMGRRRVVPEVSWRSMKQSSTTLQPAIWA